MPIVESNKPRVAAVLSLIIPGAGQFYNGAFWRGIFWLIITPGLWIGTGGLLGWVCHVVAAITAYNYAKRSCTHNVNSPMVCAELLKIEENFDILKDDRK